MIVRALIVLTFFAVLAVETSVWRVSHRPEDLLLAAFSFGGMILIAIAEAFARPHG